MSNEMSATNGNGIKDLRAAFERLQPQLALALPEHVKPERFVRIVMTAIQQNANLAKADRESLFGACMKAAQDGLLPDGREAFLNCYFSKKDGRHIASYQPMVAGILKKIRQSGELKQLSAAVVREGDEFSYSVDEAGEHFRHVPNLDSENAPVKCVYAAAWTKDGGVYFKVMGVGQIEKARAVSRAKDAGPWVDWWDEMALKTVIRNLAKRLPMSAEVEEVIRRVEDLYDFGTQPSEAPDNASADALKSKLLARQTKALINESLIKAGAMPAILPDDPPFDPETGEITGREPGEEG